jgi:AcrR family transcriptional regulator
MPPRTRFTAERILAAALALTRQVGIEGVTARTLAAKLGCSTGPISSHFSSMDDLHEQLVDQIIDLFVAAAAEPGTSDPLLVVGQGWLWFAWSEPRLYEALFLRHHDWHAKWGPIRHRLADRMAEHARYAHLDPGARFALVGRASIVLHGLGVEIWSGRLRFSRPDAFQEVVAQFVLPVVNAALSQSWFSDLHSQSPGMNT